MLPMVFFLLLLLSFAEAQWSNDPIQNLQISNFGYFVKACEDGKGGAFICWDLPGDEPFTWVQWVDRYGYIRWTQPIPIAGLEDNQRAINIIRSEDNTAILAYYDMRYKYTLPPPVWERVYKNFITLTKIDTLGNFLWGVNGVTVTIDTTHQSDAVVVADKSGGAYLTWGDVYPLWGDRDSTIVRLQRISANGQRLWGDSGRYVYKAPANYYVEPYVNNRIPEGIFFRYPQKNVGLVMESIESSGNINWSIVNNWYGKPIPALDGGGVWAFLTYKPNSANLRIMANRMDSQGNLVWSDSGLVVEDNLSVLSSVSDFDILSDNSLIVFWKQSPYPGTSDFRSYIQIINENGYFQFPDSSKLITISDGEVIGLSITLSDSLNFILNWQDSRLNNPGYYSQKYNKNMEKLWINEDVLYSTRDQEDHITISDGNFGFIAIWDEFASPAFGVFAQQVNKNGNLGEPLTSIKIHDPLNSPRRFQLHQNYPNPFNSSTSISYYIPHKSNIKITVHNTLGQSVRTLFKGIRLPGNHIEYWDGSDDQERPLPSGIYYIELVTAQSKQIKKAILIK